MTLKKFKLSSDSSNENFCYLINFDSDDKCSPQELAESLLNSRENLEEKEKVVFICSCAIECVKGGGSVLIPVSQLGTLLQLLEQMTASVESSAMKVLFLLLNVYY